MNNVIKFKTGGDMLDEARRKAREATKVRSFYAMMRTSQAGLLNHLSPPSGQGRRK